MALLVDLATHNQGMLRDRSGLQNQSALEAQHIESEGASQQAK
jgi:hypothetical protein